MAARSFFSISEKTALSPPHRKMRAPCSAGTLEPETGASRKRAPLAVTAACISAMRSGVSVEQSTMVLPGPHASSTRGKTASDASIVESILYVTPAALTTASGDEAMLHANRL